MKYSLLLLALALTGCSPISQKSEVVDVVQLSYTPSQTSTGVGPTFGAKGGVAVTTSTTSAEYDVIVDCPVHGRVIIKSRRLFNRAKAGQRVEVVYSEYWYGNYHDPK